jgi:hypothetical protein
MDLWTSQLRILAIQVHDGSLCIEVRLPFLRKNTISVVLPGYNISFHGQIRPLKEDKKK